MAENNTSIVVNGNIESSYKTAFEENYYKLAGQRQSYLGNTPAVINKPFSGKIYGISRAGGVELKPTAGGTSLRKYDNYVFDRRWATKESWSKHISMKKEDILDAIADPTSVIYSSITDAVNVLNDRVIIKSAYADVKVGSELDSIETITAEADGVTEIDATAGYNYDIVKKVSTAFKQNYVNGVKIIAQTPNEESELLDDEKMINKDYRNIQNTAVETGNLMPSLGLNFISSFAGSDNGTGGVGKINNPIIPEIGGFRYCPAFGEGAVQIALNDVELDFIERNPFFENASTISIILRTYGIRLEGKRIMKIKVTI
jgi:hypothetical protein